MPPKPEEVDAAEWRKTEIKAKNAAMRKIAYGRWYKPRTPITWKNGQENPTDTFIKQMFHGPRT